MTCEFCTDVFEREGEWSNLLSEVAEYELKSVFVSRPPSWQRAGLGL